MGVIAPVMEETFVPKLGYLKQYLITCVVSNFRCELNEIFALLCSYAASSGNSLPTFRDQLSVPSAVVKHSRNVGAELPPSAA